MMYKKERTKEKPTSRGNKEIFILYVIIIQRIGKKKKACRLFIALLTQKNPAKLGVSEFTMRPLSKRIQIALSFLL